MTYQTNETVLRVEKVSKRYNVPVLRDINFEIKNITRPGCFQGQVVSLVGKSGSGKSTLFNILAGLLMPDTGRVTILRDIKTDKEGRVIDSTSPLLIPVREGDMGVVFQNSYIYPWRRVKEILRMAAKKNELLKDVKIAIEKIVQDLSLEDHLDKYSSQLSGGQRQRVCIAEQILNGGNFILLDEPFSGLDTITIDRVTKILVDLSLTDEYKTIVLISHDLGNSLAISDEAFILAKQEGLEGATITARVCLAEQGLAWQPDIKENPRFRELLKYVKSLL